MPMILITGAAGHIGKRMMKQFLNDGHACIGIDYVDNPGLPDSAFRKLDVLIIGDIHRLKCQK